MRVLVTGSAGFVGFHVASRLLEGGDEVVGVDGLTSYYDVDLKRARQARLDRFPRFRGRKFLLEDFDQLARLLDSGFDVIYHCAAQAGVRYSLEQPRAYVEANLVGTFNLLEAMRRSPPRHLLFASTSSIYGANRSIPFREIDRADYPLSFYAATKKAGEEMCHAYSHLYGMPMTMLRFFTVYGPWGRPDMALFKFVSAILADEPIEVFDGGKMRRDFTYVDDLVEAMLRLGSVAPKPPSDRRDEASSIDSLSSQAPWRVVNIGTGRPVLLDDFVAAVEKACGRTARRRDMEMQAGDVPATYANTDLLFELTGYRPATPLATGVEAFVDWYKSYFRV